MEAVAALLQQAPVLRDWRRNVASTVVILTVGTLLIAGGADWSYRSIRTWAHNKVNTNVTLPMTHWQLEVRMRWVKSVPTAPQNIHELFEAHPLKTKLYSVGLLCSPRWALLWAWLFDRDPGLKLLQLHISQHQAHVMGNIKRVVQAIVPELLPESVLEAAADDSPIMWLIQRVSQLDSTSLFWWGWLLCPGIQTAYIMFFFASRSPIKVVYATFIGLARTAVELSALLKCLQALCRRNRRAVVNSLLCCYLLPFIMTLQSLAVLLLLGVCFPAWIVHICVVAFCLWGPPVMIALMTTAWQPERHRPLGVAEAPAGFAADGAGIGAVDAVAALVGAGPVPAVRGAGHAEPGAAAAGGGVWGWRASTHDSVYWPKPLTLPDDVEEACSVPHYFICPITHSIMLEPAVTVTGATYERSAIMEWLKAQKRDPLTSRELRPEQVSPNLALYQAIGEWIDASKQRLEAQAQQQQQQEGADKRLQQQPDKKGKKKAGSRRSSIDTGAPAADSGDQHGRQQAEHGGQ